MMQGNVVGSIERSIRSVCLVNVGGALDSPRVILKKCVSSNRQEMMAVNLLSNNIR